ncbi:hypothetical protein [Actinoplanes sp. NPDC089786]|uniref:hypothetical protein n=1 Tax=Actinoplanes sp. NPDC089786 TaxID=3155185 RepID=UPI0034286708
MALRSKGPSTIVFGDVISVEHVGRDVIISKQRPPYRFESFPMDAVPLAAGQARRQPSRLLLARHQIVPLVGRDDELADVCRWLDSPGQVRLRLVHAPGGHGKTRLAQEAAARSFAAGWSVWRALHSPMPPPNSQAAIGETGRVLVADERRQAAVDIGNCL